jgi:hypothetical protein
VFCPQWCRQAKCWFTVISAPRRTIRYPVNAVLRHGRRSRRASLSGAIVNGLVCHTTAREPPAPLKDDRRSLPAHAVRHIESRRLGLKTCSMIQLRGWHCAQVTSATHRICDGLCIAWCFRSRGRAMGELGADKSLA